MMEARKKQRLEQSGWSVGDAKDFLGLSSSEAAYVEIKAALAGTFTNKRHELRLSQTVAAKRLRSSQSRVAKMEAADPSVSLDLLVRSVLALGGTASELAHAISPARRPSQRRPSPPKKNAE